jgi:hypothetical protein
LVFLLNITYGAGGVKTSAFNEKLFRSQNSVEIQVLWRSSLIVFIYVVRNTGRKARSIAKSGWTATKDTWSGSEIDNG